MSSSPSLPSPWKEFLTELDAKVEPVELHCIGGFVIRFCYGLYRVTGDIDYYTAIPASVDLQTLAGAGSPLARKHKIWLQRVTVMPEDYEMRLSEMFPGQFKNLRLFAPDPYDYILSKLERNSGKDREDADYLFKALSLDSTALRNRYQNELRPYLSNEDRHDRTLKLWIEIFETAPASEMRVTRFNQTSQKPTGDPVAEHDDVHDKIMLDDLAEMGLGDEEVGKV